MASRDAPSPDLNHPFTPHWQALGPSLHHAAQACWIVAITGVTIFSLLPSFAPPGDYGLDKMLHAAGYMSLALLPHAGFVTRRAALTAALAMIPLGCAIEVAQGFVPGRYGDPWDAAANSAGVLIGLALGARFRKIVAAMLGGAR